SASVGCANARAVASTIAMLIRATTTASRRLAVAARRGLSRAVDLCVRAIAEHVIGRLHRRVGEVLAAIARNDRAAGERDQRDRDDDTASLHRGILRHPHRMSGQEPPWRTIR